MAYWTSLTREPHKYPEDYMKQEGGIDELFRQASKIKDDSTRTREELLVERRNDGAKRFIRKAFGFFGNSAVKSLDEMARLLYETGMVSSQEEGREVTPGLAGYAVRYGPRSVGIGEVQDGRGNRAYEVFTFFSLKRGTGLEHFFWRTPKTKFDDDGKMTEQEWRAKQEIYGAKKLKRKALGFFGNSAVKSLDEMARLLYETGMVSSEEEGRQEMPSFAGKAFCYGRKTLGISEMQDGRGNRVYEIFAFPTTPETETEEMTLRSERWKDRYAMLKKFAHPLRTLCSDIELRWDWR